MNIDLTKLIQFKEDKIEFDNVISIPKEYLNNNDIKDISDVKVNGYITYNNEYFDINMNIKCDLTLICSISLKDVLYKIDINVNDSFNENDEEIYKIINNSIDLLPIIWQNILMEVPMKVVHPDIEEKNIYGDGWKFITNEEENNEIDPRLSKLEEFLSE